MGAIDMYVSKEQIIAARELDLLTYLQLYEPQELVCISSSLYQTKSHDSLKISNGKWYWWSRGIGGRSALDYLIKVRGMSLPEAVIKINGGYALSSAEGKSQDRKKQIEKKKILILPKRHANNQRVFSYLTSRGIDAEIINHCIREGQLYEDAKYHNCVFVGFHNDEAKYASFRGTKPHSVFVGEAEGSDKRYSFAIPKTVQNAAEVYVFESAIDAMSYLTLEAMNHKEWRKINTISLAGIQKKRQDGELKLPEALKQYLKEHPSIKRIHLCLDCDEAGKTAAEDIKNYLKDYDVMIRLPEEGKDYNDLLQLKKGIYGSVKTRGKEAR
jgi:hypothetical protein